MPDIFDMQGGCLVSQQRTDTTQQKTKFKI